VDIFVSKEEENVLKIAEEVTDLYIISQTLINEGRMWKKKEIRHNFYSFIRQTWL